MPTPYADFHLTIIRNQDRYRARVTTSPVGQAAIDFSLPFSQDEVRLLSWRSGFSPRHIALVRSPTNHSAPLTLEEFGTRLFDAVFADAVGQLFFRSLDEAQRRAINLRVRLQLDDVPELAELPWEYLYSRQLDRFLVLSTRTPLVRYVGLAQLERSLAVPLPLRILAILSNPTDLPHLNVEEEWTRMNHALAGLVERGLIVLERLEGATLALLRQALRRQAVNILHFMGHGFFDPAQDEGSLVFVNGAGQQVDVTATQLATLLHDHAPLRLVFLNACHGASSGYQDAFAGVAQKLVQQGVPAVVAMQFAVNDPTAIALAHEFYQSLTDGFPLESAVSEARKAIYSEGDDYEWGTPVLFSRSADGMISVLAPQPEKTGEKSDEETSKDAMDNSKESNASAAPQDLPWWQQLGKDEQGLSALRAIGATGDVIIGIAGAGSSNVAIGKQITQIVGPATPNDKELITQKLAEVEAALAAQQGAMDAAKAQIARSYLELLRGELTKTEVSATPSASTITLVGNWLLDNVPEILETLTSLFATPAVGRVVGKAGDVAVTWVKQRFA